ncbi:MAG: acetate--CoA ligase family protein [Pseudomonadota bacterium]
MNALEMVNAALARGQRALSEFESKILLAQYDVPTTREGLAHTEDQAAALALEIGFPTALKACSPDLMHKSEKGWIELGLRSEEDVRRAFSSLLARADQPLDGVLVQEMVSGQRELVLGLSRDPQFGPCVMLGLGGVLTEVFRDAVFRMAPLDLIEARDMADELKSKAILGAFRGQAPADLEAICRALVGLGRLGLELDQVAEVDVNPLIIDRDGRVRAVDALVVLGGGRDA